jgi:hypothetical protein
MNEQPSSQPVEEKMPIEVITGTQFALTERWIHAHGGSEEEWFIRYPVFFRHFYKDVEKRKLILEAFHEGFPSDKLESIQKDLDKEYGEFCFLWQTKEGRESLIGKFGQGFSAKGLMTLEKDLDAAYARATRSGDRAQAA